MEEQTPSEVFRQRMREVREHCKLSQEDLCQRLVDIGFALRRSSIREIEKGSRRISLDEALAIAAALGVAPVYMFTPFESDDPIEFDGGLQAEEQFTTITKLKIGEKLAMTPWEARRWTRGTEIYSDAPPDRWATYYCDAADPGTRHRLREAADAIASGLEPSAADLQGIEAEPTEMAGRDPITGEARSYPTSLYTWLIEE
jgi:transcriptional regulator with XRE-family HTH domain